MYPYRWASQVVLVVKNQPTNAGDIRDTVFIPGLGRFPAGGHGNPLQYSCLENPKDRRAWQAIVHTVTKSQTGLKRLSTHMKDGGYQGLGAQELGRCCLRYRPATSR